MSQNLFRFGPFTFDLAGGVLTRQDRPVRLSRQPARLLALLLEQPGAVVSRSAIAHALWEDGLHVDEEAGINFAVRQLRQALDDHAGQAIWIETRPRVGYRFAGALVPAADASERVRPTS